MKDTGVLVDLLSVCGRVQYRSLRQKSSKCRHAETPTHLSNDIYKAGRLRHLLVRHFCDGHRGERSEYQPQRDAPNIERDHNLRLHRKIRQKRILVERVGQQNQSNYGGYLAAEPVREQTGNRSGQSEQHTHWKKHHPSLERRVTKRILQVDWKQEVAAKHAKPENKQHDIAQGEIVTGSNGKTTVKEMLAAILSQQGAVLATQANFNNEVGVPHTLLQITDQHVAAVIEEGASHPGDIAYLTEFVQPAVALVTNAAGAHLEGFGSLDVVAKTKGEIFEGLSATGVAVINADDAYANVWRSQAGDRRVVSFGMAMDADVRGTVQADGGLQIATAAGDIVVRLSLEGRHNAMNALAATAAALAAGASLSEVKKGLESVVPVPGRLQRKPAIKGAQILDDTYNANPASLSVALDVLAECPADRYLALGDMAELGSESAELHEQAGRQARVKGVQRLYAVGEYARYAAVAFGDEGLHFSAQEQLISRLKEDLNERVTLLVKGSRSSHMERVVAALTVANNVTECAEAHH